MVIKLSLIVVNGYKTNNLVQELFQVKLHNSIMVPFVFTKTDHYADRISLINYLENTVQSVLCLFINKTWKIDGKVKNLKIRYIYI